MRWKYPTTRWFVGTERQGDQVAAGREGTRSSKILTAGHNPLLLGAAI